MRAFWICHLLSWNPSSCQQSIGGAIKLFATVISNFYCVVIVFYSLEVLRAFCHFLD